MANEKKEYEEKQLKALNGFFTLFLILLMFALSIYLFIIGTVDDGDMVMIIAGALLFCIACFLPAGLKILKPNEALVLTLFGKYYGTLRKEGFFFVNPFTVALNPAFESDTLVEEPTVNSSAVFAKSMSKLSSGKKLSLKTMTMNNEKQKINDLLGNPIEIGIVVIWRVENTAKAVFNVDNYKEFLSIQCDSALRDVTRLYPYDVSLDDDGDEKSLRGSSQEVAKRLQEEIQSRVGIAGLEIIEARITHLAYAAEIAAAMLQRQQASAIIDARKMIVDGAVGMVEMALTKLSEEKIVDLDDERKASMVSNLLVVLCGNKDAQPIVNSGSIY